MKILEQTSTKLVIRGKPFDVWISGLIALVIWLVSFYCLLTFPFNSTLLCEKTIFNRVNCEITESSLLDNSLTQKSITNLGEAAIGWDSRNPSILLKTYTNVLGFPIPFKKIHFPTNGFLVNFSWSKSKQIEIINTFIKYPSKDKVLRLALSGQRFLPFYIFWLVIPFWSSLATLSYPIETYTFDRDFKQLTLFQKELLGKARLFEYKFQYISEIKLEEKEIRNQEKIYAIAITIGQTNKPYVMYRYKSKDKAQEMVNLIQKYLEV